MKPNALDVFPIVWYPHFNMSWLLLYRDGDVWYTLVFIGIDKVWMTLDTLISCSGRGNLHCWHKLRGGGHTLCSSELYLVVGIDHWFSPVAHIMSIYLFLGILRIDDCVVLMMCIDCSIRMGCWMTSETCLTYNASVVKVWTNGIPSIANHRHMPCYKD